MLLVCAISESVLLDCVALTSMHTLHITTPFTHSSTSPHHSHTPPHHHTIGTLLHITTPSTHSSTSPHHSHIPPHHLLHSHIPPHHLLHSHTTIHHAHHWHTLPHHPHHSHIPPHHLLHWHTTTHAVSILQVAYLGTAVAIPFSVSGDHQYPPTHFCSLVAVKERPNIPDIYLGYFSISHLGLSLLEAILFCAQLFVLYKLRKRGYFRFFNSVWWLLGLPLLLATIGELLTTTLSIKSQSNQSVLIKSQFLN